MSSVPKTLLVTLTPPGARNVGEIILRDYCALLPPERLCVLSASDTEPSSSPYTTCRFSPPCEDAWRPVPGRAGGLLNYARIRTAFAASVREMTGAVAAFGRREQVERVWLALNSLPLVAAGGDMARSLGVPLYSLVWDPPDYLARQKGWDRASRRWLAARFADALRHSERVLVVSENMAETYGREYGADCVVVRHALGGTPLALADGLGDPGSPLRIGFAGTLYDTSQLNVLLAALNGVQWRLGGRTVILRMIGNWFRFNGLTSPCNIELLGWQSTEDTRQLLAECHVNYLPISFGADWGDFARLSFPTKLSTYLSTGRPVLVHGPSYSSSSSFCSLNGCGEVCTLNTPADLMAALHHLIDDPARYLVYALAAHRACADWLSQDTMRRQFASFMGLCRSELVGASAAA